MKHNKKIYLCGLSTLVAQSLLTPFAMAQAPSTGSSNVLEEVVVTAQRREEALVDVPISVTSLSSEQLVSANVNTLVDTAKVTPGLRFDTQGVSTQPTIRGVGTAITTSGGGPNVGIYVDGFFQFNSFTTDFDLLRLKSIQVLKGPQGTLFGRNTTGGAILVSTDDPSTETSAEAKISYGRYNAQTVQGYATFGLTDDLAFDIEGLYRKGDGYFDDKLAGDDDFSEYESWSVRTGLKWDISDAVSILLRYTHADKEDPTYLLANAFVDDGDAGFLKQVSQGGRDIYGVDSSRGLPLVYFYAPAVVPVPTKPGDVALNQPISFNSESDIYQMTINADLGYANLTSYTSIREDESPSFADLDATALPIFGLSILPEDTSYSQEFILNSNSSSALQWTVGLNYFEIEDTWDIAGILGGVPDPDYEYGGSTTTTKSYAAFIDATYQMAENWYVTLGGRYSDDRVEDASFDTNAFTFFYTGPDGEFVPFSGPAGTSIPVDDLKNDDFTPRAVLRHTPTDNSSVYVSFTQGYKAGILNVGGASQQPVKSEEIDAWEVGYKFDNRQLALELAGYYYDYKNLQVSSYQSGAAQIRNAASSEIYGLDGQVRWQASSNFGLNAGFAWTHARYDSFENAPYYSYCDPTAGATSLLFCLPAELGGLGVGSLVQSLTDASGGEMQRAPEWTGNLGANYDINLGESLLILSGNIYYTSSFYFDPEQQFKQDDYTIVSLRGEWTSPGGGYSVALYGDNVTDEDYRTQVLFNTLGIASVWGAPATWGISLNVKI